MNKHKFIVPVGIDPDTLLEMDRHCDKEGLSRSAFVRIAVKKTLEAQGKPLGCSCIERLKGFRDALLAPTERVTVNAAIKVLRGLANCEGDE